MNEKFRFTNNRKEVKGGKNVKRKAEYNTVEKTSKTPKKNLREAEFSTEFGGGEPENPAKGFNRNSKQGRQGK